MLFYELFSIERFHRKQLPSKYVVFELHESKVKSCLLEMLCVLEHDHQLKLALSIVILPLYAFPIRLALQTLKLNK
jgi:hypothetical protein